MYDLVIDARMQYHGGIGTYLRNLLPYLESSGLRIAKIEKGPPIYSLREQLLLPFLIPPCHVFWSPHFNIPLLPILATYRLVSIHDLYHLAHIAELTLLQKIYAKYVIRKAIKKAHSLIIGSLFTKQELYKFFPDFSGRVECIPYGPGSLLPPEEPMDIPKPFFLFVGNLKPHKNLHLLLNAFEHLKETHSLIIAGKKEGFLRGIDTSILSGKKYVHLLGQVTAPQLTYLYKQATALVFPSLYEGWGFPPIEAMQAECPVLAANSASIPEACGDAALYFDPKDSKDLVRLMKKISSDFSLRKLLIEQGKQRIKNFSWQECAKKHLALIRSLIKTQFKNSK